MSRATLAFVLVVLAATFAPPAQAWEATAELSRCFYYGAVRVCYRATTTVFANENAQGKIESCDIKGTDEESWLTHPGLSVRGNALYGPGYVDLAPGSPYIPGISDGTRASGCSSTKRTVYYDGMTRSCVNGGTQGWVHTSMHWIRWRDGAHQWRGDNVETTRTKTLPWPISSCNCGNDGGGSQP